MRLPVGLTFLVVIAVTVLIGISVRWYKFKEWPEKSTKTQYFEIDRNMVKNPEANRTYYGTINITTTQKAGNWPNIETIIKQDTLSEEEGGYFGEEN